MYKARRGLRAEAGLLEDLEQVGVHALSAQRRLARGWAHFAREHVDRRRLASAVRPKQRKAHACTLTASLTAALESTRSSHYT